MGVGERVGRALHEAVHDDGFEPELADRVLELVDRLLGRDHRDGRHRAQPVTEIGERLRVVAVQRAARGAAFPLVLQVQVDQPDARIHHGEVDAEVGEPFVQE